MYIQSSVEEDIKSRGFKNGKRQKRGVRQKKKKIASPEEWFLSEFIFQKHSQSGVSGSLVV